MEKSQEILQVIGASNGIKAKDIAAKIGLDKKQVNSLLYGKLRPKVYQDNRYKWFLTTDAPVEKEDVKSKEQNNPIAQLSKYYLDCLGRDIDVEVSVFASSKYGCPDYGLIDSLPFVDDSDITINNCSQEILRKVSRDRNRLNLVLGYPLYLHEFTSKKGVVYQKVEPLFLFHFDQSSVNPNGNPVLADILPHLNGTAFKNLSGAKGAEILTEMISLYEELGIDEEEEAPEWDDIFHRLQDVRDEWGWQENLDVYNLSDTDMTGDLKSGVYNTAGIFASERSKYTVGLERELNDLTKKSKDYYDGTALSEWVNRDLKTTNKKEYQLIEPLPMNEEQRQAVEKSLSNPLTVITGPPGTGKSQVVTNILVNAVYNGQRVLFASKNHKAVNVVNERVNGLSTKPMVLRLGSAEARGDIATYMTSLLSSSVSDRDRNEFTTLKKKAEDLQTDLEKLTKLQSVTVGLRNKLDDKEQRVEEFRKTLGDNVFRSIKSWDVESFSDLRTYLNDFINVVNEADKRKQNVFKRLIWFALRKSSFKKLEEKNELLNQVEHRLKKSVTTVSIDDLTGEFQIIDALRNRVKELEKLIEISVEVKEYYRLLDGLKEKPSLFVLSKQLMRLHERIYENSQNLWDYYSKLLPERLSEVDRKLIGDFATILKMITQADEQGTNVEKKVWAKYYSILPKVSGIFSAWAITSLSVRGRVPSEPGFFDLVVIDEASQCDIASAIPLLYRAKRAVIIGDPMQLRHISMLNQKEDHQMMDRYGLLEDHLSWSYSSNSLFDLASSISGADSIINLRDHHRSHSHIIEFSNKEFYDSSLRVATKYDNLKFIPDEPALNWKHISGKASQHSSGGSVNQVEATEVMNELTRLVDNDYKGSVGVVTPFRQQANLIREIIYKDRRLSEQLTMRNFLVDTVHKFQGDERDVMIFSPVYSKGIPRGSEIFLRKNGNLFNVAITRARASLIVIGDKAECQKSEVGYLSNFATYVDEVNQEKRSSQTERNNLGAKFPEEYKSPMVSDWEVYFYERLYEAGIRTLPQFQVGQYRLDLAIIDGARRLDIEVDGEHYHRNWDGDLIWRDQLRNMRLIEEGWDVKRFWVYEIRDDLERCVEEIKKWIKEN